MIFWFATPINLYFSKKKYFSMKEEMISKKIGELKLPRFLLPKASAEANTENSCFKNGKYSMFLYDFHALLFK